MIQKRVFHTSLLEDQGFTLTEIVVVVSIIGILAVAAFANYVAMRPTNNMHKFGRELVGAIQQARAEAVRRNACVRISFTDDDGDSSTSVPNFPLGHPAYLPGKPAAVPADLTGLPNINRGGYWIHTDDGAGGGIACDNLVNGAEKVRVVIVPDHVTFTASDFAATTNDPNVRSINPPVDSDLLEQFSFNSRALIQARTFANNQKAYVLRNDPDPAKATWWGRVVVNPVSGTAHYQTNNKRNQETSWSE